jgi:hypothetical protein
VTITRLPCLHPVPRYGFNLGFMAKTPTAEDWAPASCTLPTVEQPLRLAEFDAFFRGAVRRSTRPSATRLDLVILRESGAAARDLAERETRCCSLFCFKYDDVADGLVMRISVPKDHVDVLDALQARIFTVVGVTPVNADV